MYILANSLYHWVDITGWLGNVEREKGSSCFASVLLMLPCPYNSTSQQGFSALMGIGLQGIHILHMPTGKYSCLNPKDKIAGGSPWSSSLTLCSAGGSYSREQAACSVVQSLQGDSGDGFTINTNQHDWCCRISWYSQGYTGWPTLPSLLRSNLLVWPLW